MNVKKLFFSAPRVASRIRLACPAGGIALWLTIGQALWSGLSKESALVLSVLICFALFRRELSAYMIALCVGAIVCVRPPGQLLPSHREVPLIAEVVRSPRYRSAGGAQYYLRVHSLQYPGPGSMVLCTAADLPWKNLSSARTGSRFIFVPKYIRALDLNQNAYHRFLARQGIDGSCAIQFATKSVQSEPLFSSLRHTLARRIEALNNSSEASRLLTMILLGQKDRISRNTEDAFKKIGVSHVLVVSGYHLGIFFVLMIWLVKRLCMLGGASHRNTFSVARLIALGSSLCYCLLTGSGAASKRAIIALATFVLAKNTNRIPSFGTIIVSSWIVVLVLWPGCWQDSGTQLSFAALSGIWLAQSGGRGGAWWRIPLSASAATAVVSSISFAGISLSGFVMNIFFAPLVALLACWGGVVALCVHLCHLDHSGLLLQAIVAVLEFCIVFARRIASLEYAFLDLEPVAAWIVSAAALMILSVLCIRKRRTFLMHENVYWENSASVSGEMLGDTQRSHIGKIVNNLADTSNHAA